MSQFNSLRSRGNYANAGKAAANSALRLFIAARRSSPDYGQLAQKGAQLRSEEKKQLINIKGELAARAIQVKSKLKADQIEMDAELAAKKDRRMAGLLSAAGKKAGYGLFKMGQKPQERIDSNSSIDLLKTQEEQLRTRAQEIKDGIPTFSTNTDGNSTGDKQGADSTGKVSTAPLSSTVPKIEGGWQRLSRVIHVGEGTTGDKGYTTMFGGGQFTDLSRHPDQVVSASGYNSSAAGKYQFLTPTWNEARDALGLQDFSPESQEKAGRFLTQRRGVDPDKVYTNFNDFKDAMDKLAPEWASLPYSKTSPKGFGNGSSYYGQGGIDINEAWRIYNE